MAIAALICSSDYTTVLHLEQACKSFEITPTICSNVRETREHLSMAQFDLLLADARLGIPETTELLMTAWKHNPLLFGILFRTTGKIVDAWEAQFYGADIIDGAEFDSKIKRTLAAFKQARALKGEDNKKILFIEDLDAPRQIVSAYLESLGFLHVDAYSEAMKAFEQLKEHPSEYFCVLSDIRMPDVDGIQLANKIRNTSATAHIPIIFLTAIPSIENVIDALRAGATGFLAKPPTKRLLRAELEKAQRIYRNKQSPRLCEPDQAHLLEDAIRGRIQII